MNMEQKKTILKVVRKNGKTIMKNDTGSKWESLGNMPERYALGALIFFTLEKAFETTECYSDEFEIELTIKLKDNDSEV